SAVDELALTTGGLALIATGAPLEAPGRPLAVCAALPSFFGRSPHATSEAKISEMDTTRRRPTPRIDITGAARRLAARARRAAERRQRARPDFRRAELGCAMADHDFDLFTLGAGSGGVAASRRAGSYGAKVAI